MRRIYVLLFFVLTGCASTQTMPLAPNIVRIATTAQGIIGRNQVVPQTMKTAAKETLDRGYTHFRFTDADLVQSERMSRNTRTVYGTYGRGVYDAWGTKSITTVPVTNAAVTVIMFKANDAESEGAFDAREIFLRY